MGPIYYNQETGCPLTVLCDHSTCYPNQKHYICSVQDLKPGWDPCPGIGLEYPGLAWAPARAHTTWWWVPCCSRLRATYYNHNALRRQREGSGFCPPSPCRIQKYPNLDMGEDSHHWKAWVNTRSLKPITDVVFRSKWHQWIGKHANKTHTPWHARMNNNDSKHYELFMDIQGSAKWAEEGTLRKFPWTCFVTGLQPNPFGVMPAPFIIPPRHWHGLLQDGERTHVSERVEKNGCIQQTQSIQGPRQFKPPTSDASLCVRMCPPHCET